MEPPTDIYTMTVDPTEAPTSRSTWSSSSRAVLPYAIDGSQKSFLGSSTR